MHGVLRRHSGHGPGVELPQLLPRLPLELHQEVGSLPGLTGGGYGFNSTLMFLKKKDDVLS